MSLAHIVKKPIITEKSLQRVGKNQYTFEVHLGANKVEVAEAVAALFDVNVLTVKMVVRKGRVKRILGTRKMTQTGKKKIAIVTIDPKQSIELFSEFTEEKKEEKKNDKDKKGK